MTRTSAVLLGVGLVATAAAARPFGGWVVVTVAKVPDAWVVGRPLQLTWQVRLHGVSPMRGLRPTLEARSGTRRVVGTALEFGRWGQERGYRGHIAFPEPGEWQVTIHSGFGRKHTVLVPFAVVDTVRPVRGTVEAHLAALGVPPASQWEAGRRQFAGKGCVTCHRHADAGIVGDMTGYGPDLTRRRFPPEYLARFLADPSIKRAADGGPSMPNLGLREKDIAPLVAFLNGQRRHAGR